MPASIRLNIAEPCHQDWEQMIPQREGRHCSSCQKIVTDFSNMSDKEILAHIGNAAHGICGRITGDQLNKEMPVAEKKKLPLWAYAWNFAAATFLLAINANGQGKSSGKSPVQKVNSQKPQPIVMGNFSMVKIDRPEVVHGLVFDKETNQMIPGATVQVKGTQYATSADSSGNFTIKRTDNDVLTVSAIGYKTAEYLIDESGGIPVIYLEPEAKVMDEVVITGYGTIRCFSAFSGGISVVRTETLYTRAAREIRDWFPNKDIQVYPNPALPGGSVKIKLVLPETGKYSMEVFSTNGTRVHSQPLVITAKEQITVLPVSAQWARGAYWIRVSGPQTKKVYHTKLLVQ